MTKPSVATSTIASPRRRLMRRATGAAASVAAAITVFFAGPSLLAPLVAYADEVIKGPPVKDLPIRQLSPHVWIIEAPDGFPTPENQGMMANIVMVVTSKGVVMLDTGASLQIGEMAIRQLSKVTNKPVIAIYTSHYHGDHFLGNQAFTDKYGKSIPIYAHPKTIEAVVGAEGKGWASAMERWTNLATAGTLVVPPNTPIDHGASHNYGDVTIKVHHYGRAHTTGDICMEIVEDKVTYVGDVAMDRRIANMDDGSYAGTLKTFEQLQKNTSTQIWIPGHGEPSAQLLAHYGELFSGIYESAKKAVKEGQPLETVKTLALADPRVSKWAKVTKGWDSNIGKYANLAFLEAEADDF